MNSSSVHNSSLLSSSLDDRNTTDCFKVTKWLMVTRGVLVLPLSILTLYMAQQQWRQQRSKIMTHTDVITTNQATVELFWPLATGFTIWGYSSDLRHVSSVGFFLTCLTFFGQSLFHLLTCFERYLAVVYPVTYKGLRNERGVRIRNISIGCVWLLCFTFSSTAMLPISSILILHLTLLSAIFGAISFFSIYVLCLLICWGSGGKSGKGVDQRKQKALFVIMVIFGLLWVWFFGYFTGTAMAFTNTLSDYDKCMVQCSSYVFCLPSNISLLLLYLHRKGKLNWCQCNRQ